MFKPESFFKESYLFWERGRERVRGWGGGVKEEWDGEVSQAGVTLSPEPQAAQSGGRESIPQVQDQAWAKTKSQLPNWRHHPGAPPLLFKGEEHFPLNYINHIFVCNANGLIFDLQFSEANCWLSILACRDHKSSSDYCTQRESCKIW